MDELFEIKLRKNISNRIENIQSKYQKYPFEYFLYSDFDFENQNMQVVYKDSFSLEPSKVLGYYRRIVEFSLSVFSIYSNVESLDKVYIMGDIIFKYITSRDFKKAGFDFYDCEELQYVSEKTELSSKEKGENTLNAVKRTLTFNIKYSRKFENFSKKSKDIIDGFEEVEIKKILP